jgi:hypothetical protein
LIDGKWHNYNPTTMGVHGHYALCAKSQQAGSVSVVEIIVAFIVLHQEKVMCTGTANQPGLTFKRTCLHKCHPAYLADLTLEEKQTKSKSK